MEGMSKQQKAVYDFIWWYNESKGMCPSIADVAKELSLASSTVAAYVDTLIQKKQITSEYGVPRSLRAISA